MRDPERLAGSVGVWVVGLLVFCTARGWAEETHTVERKGDAVIKNEQIDKGDEEVVAPESTVIGGGSITVTSKTFEPPEQNKPEKERWKFKSFGTTHVDIHKEAPADGLTRRVVPPAADNDTDTRIKVEGAGAEANAALWPLRCEGNLQRPSAPGGKKEGEKKKEEFHWSAKAGRIKIEYIGGTDQTDGTKEDYKSLGGDYIMRGYMLKMTCPQPKENTDVTWTIKKGESEVGTYHQGGTWADYQTALEAKPKTQTIYWRSPYTGGAIDDAYSISASFTTPEGKDATLTREIRSRELDPDNADHRDNFNEDTDMAQRAMIQMLYLDKGRLDNYRIGKYDKNAQGFYHSSRTAGNWSTIADEVYNFDRAARDQASPSYKLGSNQVKAIWDQYQLIMNAGVMASAVDKMSLGEDTYNQMVAKAVNDSGLDFPNPYAESQLLDALFFRESSRRHSKDIHAPLYWNSVLISDYPSQTGGAHQYTFGALSWGQCWPSNVPESNFYDKQGGMTGSATHLQWCLQQITVPEGNGARVWHALYQYNQGSNMQSRDPGWLRDQKDEQGNPLYPGAVYADNVFDTAGYEKPETNED